MNSIDIKEITIEDLVKDVSNEDMISEEEAIKHYEKILRNDFKEDVDTLAPTFISSSTISVDENQTNAITLRATDTNTGSSNTITYSISGTDSSFFKIKTSSGVVTFKSPPNYELLKTSYTFIAKAKDSKNNIASQDITITIVNVAEVPTLANSIGSVVENSIANTSVGTIDITNTGDSAITNIVLSGTDASNFNVNTSGAITVSNAASLDYETTHTDNLTVIATNSAGNSNSANVTRIVDDITETTHDGFTYQIITSPITSKKWLDRNLGTIEVCTICRDDASITSNNYYISNQEDCFGDLYQWGRLTDGDEKRNSGTTSTLATDITDLTNPLFII